MIVGNDAFKQTNLVNPDFSNAITFESRVFLNCSNLTNPIYANLVNVGNNCFAVCTSLENFNFSNVDNFGTNPNDTTVFVGITGKTITFTAKTIHQTSRDGNLHASLRYLSDNNTVTFVWL